MSKKSHNQIKSKSAEEIKNHKPKKDKSLKRQKSREAYAYFNFPYYNSSVNPYLLFPVKALLACFAAGFGAVFYAQLLNYGVRYQGSLPLFFIIAFAVCGAYYVLLGFFKSFPVAAYTAAAFAVYGLFRFKVLKSCFQSFYCMYWGTLIGADFNSGVPKTAWGSYLNNFDNINQSAAKFDPVPFMILLSILVGIILAFCTAKRFHPQIIIAVTALFALPAFISRSACFYPSLVIFSASLLALWSANQSMAANTYAASGGLSNIKSADRQYKQQCKRLSPKLRFSAEAKRYSKHLSDGIVIFIISALTMSFAAYSFPKDGNIKLDKAIQAVINWGTDVGDSIGTWTDGIFYDLNFKFGNGYLKGFFSADSDTINISNGINPRLINQKGKPVLEVTTQYQDKLYIRGDIGCEFDGRNWKSISKLDYSQINYNSLWGEVDSNNSETDMQKIFDSYLPEIMFLHARTSNFYGDAFIGMQTVKIDYLKNMNTVLFPGIPFSYNFRNGDNFSVYGDFVGIADKGKISSMETGVLYSRNSPENMNEFPIYDEFFDNLPMDRETFEKYSRLYNQLSTEYYTRIDDHQRNIISYLTNNIIISDSFTSENEYRYKCADEVMKYLNSGKFKYSLTADNFSGTSEPIYSFLYKTQAGHCAMFASSMCLALRDLGVPARYVTGFTVGGDYGCEKIGNHQFKYTVTDKQLHAWVEVFYDGIGWTPYDPTPGTWQTVVEPNPQGTTSTTPNPVTSAAEKTTAAVTTKPPETTGEKTDSSQTSKQPDNTITQSPTASDSENPNEFKIDPNTVKLILIILGIIFVLFLIFMSLRGAYKKLERKQKELLKFFKTGDPNKAVKQMLPFMLKLLSMMGVRRMKGETPEEFGINADNQLKMTDTVKNTIPIFEQCEFDKQPVFDTEQQLVVYNCINKLLNQYLNSLNKPKRLTARIKLFYKNK